MRRMDLPRAVIFLFSVQARDTGLHRHEQWPKTMILKKTTWRFGPKHGVYGLLCKQWALIQASRVAAAEIS